MKSWTYIPESYMGVPISRWGTISGTVTIFDYIPISYRVH